MKFTAHSSFRATSASGFTLMEMMVAVGISMILVAAVVTLGMFTGKSFSIMGNYVMLDAQSCNAADVLGKQIRNATALVSTNVNTLTLTNGSASPPQGMIIKWNTNTTALTLTLIQSGQRTVTTLLTNCYAWNFSLYNRAPNTNSFSTNITFYPATNAATCKVINMSWNCSRTVLGAKFTTESVQTAQIVLRNQVSH